ncbi:2661_t:CDS:2, partial [Racocetra fulgida]
MSPDLYEAFTKCKNIVEIGKTALYNKSICDGLVKVVIFSAEPIVKLLQYQTDCQENAISNEKLIRFKNSLMDIEKLVECVTHIRGSIEYKDVESIKNNVNQIMKEYWACVEDLDPKFSNMHNIVEQEYLKDDELEDKKDIKLPEELIREIKDSLNSCNPHHELVQIFRNYGHFVPKKVILGHKLHRMSCLQNGVTLQEEQKHETSEYFKTNEFKELWDRWYNSIVHLNFNKSYLLSMNSNMFRREDLIGWAESCLNGDNDMQFISWELYPLYELLDVNLKQSVKVIFGMENINVKNKVLINYDKLKKEYLLHWCILPKDFEVLADVLKDRKVLIDDLPKNRNLTTFIERQELLTTLSPENQDIFPEERFNLSSIGQ